VPATITAKNRQPDPQAAAHKLNTDKRAGGEDRGVREVKLPQNPEYQGEPDREQRINRAGE